MAATVVCAVCGHGFSPEPFQVAVEVAWMDALHWFGTWQSWHSAEAVLFFTKKLPYWLLCGSWQEVHCIWPLRSKRTSCTSRLGSRSSPFAATSEAL